jgi:SAM-dependent methyltransferase
VALGRVGSVRLDVMTTPRFYTSDLNTTTYDLGLGRSGPDAGDDIPFYVELARERGSRVLELGCGTGRVTLALAGAGLRVTGLDLSAGMLREASAKLARCSAETQARVKLVEADMTEFRLGEAFDAVLIPARAFAFLLTVDLQRACLAQVLEHLRPGGVLSINLFDPRLDLCVPGFTRGRAETGVDPASGKTYRVEVLSRENDTLAQVLRESWRFSELDASGSTVRVEEEQLALRWTYRYEMRHLLELAGFASIVEYSDFQRSPAAYGREQVWVCEKPPESRLANIAASSRQPVRETRGDGKE